MECWEGKADEGRGVGVGLDDGGMDGGGGY